MLDLPIQTIHVFQIQGLVIILVHLRVLLGAPSRDSEGILTCPLFFFEGGLIRLVLKNI